MNNLFYKKLIKPIRDTELSNIIKNINSKDLCPYDEKLNFQERLIGIDELKYKIQKWSSDWIVGLENFNYVYVLNGNTDNINTIFFTNSELMHWNKYDYTYYKYWHVNNQKQYLELEKSKKVSSIIASWPGYSQGDDTEINFALLCNADKIHVDIAYMGLTKPIKLDVKNFQTVSISFSKTLSIPYNRISLLYSKNKIPHLEILNNIGYVNLSGVNLVNKILDHFSLNYWWEKYSKYLDVLCKNNNLIKTNCILFAYDSQGNRVSLAEYWRKIFND